MKIIFSDKVYAALLARANEQNKTIPVVICEIVTAALFPKK